MRSCFPPSGVAAADATVPAWPYRRLMSSASQANAWTAAAERSQVRNDQLTEVCGAVAAVYRRAWGRGPTKVTAHWAGRNMLVVLLENGHTDAEKTMRAAGHIQELLGGRHLLQVLIEDDLKASVEQILQRPVETTLSATRLDPDLSAEIFLFGNAKVEALGSLSNG
jgi:uncharacterized protein YbcI